MEFKSARAFKITASLVCCCSVILINIAIFTGLIVDSLIDRQISDQLTMTSSNIDVWGQVPGKYDISVLRNLTVFSIVDPEAFFSGSTPVQVRHSEPIILREKHITGPPSFSADQNLVTFNQSITYDLAMDEAEYSRICSSNVTVANLYAMGAWDSAGKQFNFTMKAFYTLGAVLASSTADDDIYFECVSLAVQVAYIARNKFQDLFNKDFQPAGIGLEKAQRIFSDPLFGWSNNVTLKKWGQAIVRGSESDDALFLADYFDLTYEQISKLFSGRFSKAVAEGAALVKDNYNCPATPGGRLACDPVYLIAIQVGRQEVTRVPPPPVLFPDLGRPFSDPRREERECLRPPRVLVLLQRDIPFLRLKRLCLPKSPTE